MATVNSGATETFSAGETTFTGEATIDGELSIAGTTNVTDANGDATLTGTATLFATSPQGDAYLVAAGETLVIEAGERTFVGTQGIRLNGSIHSDGSLLLADANVGWAGVAQLLGAASVVSSVPIRRRDSASIDYGQERDEYALDDTDPP